MEDFEAVVAGLEALDAEGTDTEEEQIEGALAVVDALVETSREEEFADDEYDESRQFLVDARDSMEEIAAGDGVEDDVERSLALLAAVAEQMKGAALAAVLQSSGAGL